MTHLIKLSSVLLLFPFLLQAQETKTISLQEAVQLGIANSKNLKLSENQIEEANSRLAVVKDEALPSASASFMYNHAEIPSNRLSLGETTVNLPRRSDAFVGTASLQQLVYGGGKLRYAEESTRLLTDIARLDVEKNKDEVGYAVVNTYFNLFKVIESKKIVAQNLASIASQLKQSQRFFEQGIVTKNDVLRFQLQQANVSLTALEIENNRKILNYNLNILLGLPEETLIEVTDPKATIPALSDKSTYIDQAMNTRQELRQLDIRNKVEEVNVKSIKANLLPTFGLGANLYYLNPSGSFIPGTNQYLVPMTVGANLSWNIGSLWNNKNKISEAQVEQKSVVMQKGIVADDIKKEINANYQNYLLALGRIKILETSIEQASENDRLLASKYKNNVASAIDRIDAETLLYQAKINLELATADAGLAYYTLLKSTGKLSQQ